ncbi:hypothetical protein [Bariatricus massiliensis]|nr:hypothetical protein [Bariatricus massiliensis]
MYEELKKMEDGPYSIPYDTDLSADWKQSKGTKPNLWENKR